VLCLAVAAPAKVHAKAGARAHLESHLRKRAKPGTTIRVVWTLYVIEHGERRPFDAGDLFVRLRGRSGFARAYGDGQNGRYAARLKVPRGGMTGIRFGLEGVRMYPDGRTERGDHYFPLDNDPFVKR
jgi:hypothetical protein